MNKISSEKIKDGRLLRAAGFQDVSAMCLPLPVPQLDWGISGGFRIWQPSMEGVCFCWYI